MYGKCETIVFFYDKKVSVYSIIHQVEYLYHMYPVPKLKKKIKCIGIRPQIFYPCGFFDGAAAWNTGGVGFVLLLSDSHTLGFSLGCGTSTNTRAKLLALWDLLAVSREFRVEHICIVSDS